MTCDVCGRERAKGPEGSGIPGTAIGTLCFRSDPKPGVAGTFDLSCFATGYQRLKELNTRLCTLVEHLYHDPAKCGVRALLKQDEERADEFDRLKGENTRLIQEREARFDCHAGPGTATPACGTCTTCLLRENTRQAEEIAHLKALQEATAREREKTGAELSRALDLNTPLTWALARAREHVQAIRRLADSVDYHRPEMLNEKAGAAVGKSSGGTLCSIREHARSADDALGVTGTRSDNTSIRKPEPVDPEGEERERVGPWPRD